MNRIPAALGHLLPATLAFFTPEPGASPNADSINSLYKIALYVALVVFVLVEGALGYALYRFRARKGAVAAQIRGNTTLELSWTAAAALILIVLAVITFIKLGSIEDRRTPDRAVPPWSAKQAKGSSMPAPTSGCHPTANPWKSPSSGVSTSGSTSIQAPKMLTVWGSVLVRGIWWCPPTRPSR